MPAELFGKVTDPLWSAIREELDGSAPASIPTIDANPLRNGRAKLLGTGEIDVIVEVSQWSATLLDDLATLGLNASLSNDELLSVQGWASAGAIEELLAASFVKRVRLPDYGVANAGSVTTEGDAILRTDEVRSTFASLGIDGTGIKVGVISDGVDNRATVATTGDLPASITVNPSLPGGGDEGTAMLEIVHDLAPGAELFFSSGISSAMAMVDSINWLVGQGVDIIVDDLGFFGQSYFEDDVIANTAAAAVASGVTYVSSAGNQAQDHYQTDFDFGQTLQLPFQQVQEFHDFAPGDSFMGVAIAGNGGILDVTLQWSDPFGSSTNDYNLFLVDQNLNVLFNGLSPNGIQDPFETISVTNNGASTFVGFLAIGRDVGAADRELEMFILNDAGQEYSIAGDAIIGHQAKTEVITVAAIDQNDAGNDDVEVFSSRGPSTIYTNFTTQDFTTRSSLDGAAIDNVQTKAGQLGFFSNPFLGTSAAAPHVAGIAALLLNIDPLLTPAAISTILADTAVDILAPGYDGDSGFGRFDAYAAATSILPPTITDVRLDDPTGWLRDPYSFSSIVAAGEQLKPIFTQGVDTLEIVFSEGVNMASDGSDLTLIGKNGTTVTASGFSHVAGSSIATWTFAGGLANDKYAIDLSDTITDVAGNRLDAEWDNPTNGTPDDYTDDVSDPLYKATFVSGNGTAGGRDEDMNGDSEFRFHFALLAGDYDGDGIVEAAESETGDGNGDGVVDSLDDSIGTVGDMLPLRSIGGADLNDDEIVGRIDFDMWMNGYGINAQGDVDGDGDSDGADFLLWQIAYGSFSAWYTGPAFPGTGGTAPLFLIGVAPQVTNVTISGSVSLHDPFSFDTVDGSGTQLQTVPVGGADTISITFSELVNISADSLNLIGLQTAIAPVLAEFSYDAMTMTATWRFEGWALGDQYLLSLHDSVTDIEGNLLDGEWVNPASMSTVNAAVSEFPSGDGTAGGHFNFVMTLLPGDADLDGDVDDDDYNIMYASYVAGMTSDALFTDGDFSGNGAVNIADAMLTWDQYFAQTNLADLWVLADLNGNFSVDGGDLQTISGNYGMTGATYADGDLNGDGIIDDADLDLAFAQFGLGLDWVA